MSAYPRPERPPWPPFGTQSARRLLLTLILCVLTLMLLYGLNQLAGKPSWHLSSVLDIDGEGSLPAWFSSMQLAATGVLLILASRLPSDRPVHMTRFLLLVGCGFVLLSADEAAELHERITLLTKHLDWVPSFRGTRGVWIFVYGGLGVALLGLSLPLLRAWYGRQKEAVLILVAGFLLLVLGGVALEIIGYQFVRDRGLQTVYVLLTMAEETLEMLGGSVLVYGACRLLLAEQHGAAPAPSTGPEVRRRV